MYVTILRPSTHRAIQSLALTCLNAVIKISDGVFQDIRGRRARLMPCTPRRLHQNVDKSDESLKYSKLQLTIQGHTVSNPQQAIGMIGSDTRRSGEYETIKQHRLTPH